LVNVPKLLDKSVGFVLNPNPFY